MQRKNPKPNALNNIKILPVKPPDYKEIFTTKFLEPNIKQSIRKMRREQAVSLPKLSKLPTKIIPESGSFSNFLGRPSVLNRSETLINPKAKDKLFLVTEIEKIISQCNDDSFKNSMITEQLNKTECEMQEIVDKIEKINDYNYKPRKALRIITYNPAEIT